MLPLQAHATHRFAHYRQDRNPDQYGEGTARILVSARSHEKSGCQCGRLASPKQQVHQRGYDCRYDRPIQSSMQQRRTSKSLCGYWFVRL